MHEEMVRKGKCSPEEKCKEKVASGGQGPGQVPTAAGQLRAELLVWCSLWELAQAVN